MWGNEMSKKYTDIEYGFIPYKDTPSKEFYICLQSDDGKNKMYCVLTKHGMEDMAKKLMLALYYAYGNK